MIDDDDVLVGMVLAPEKESHMFWQILWLIAFALILIFAFINTSECEAKKCNTGKPMLLKGECVCVESAK